MKIKITLLAGLLFCRASCLAQTTTAFTYQGQLSAGGSTATGLYDLAFTLFDGASGSNLIAGPVTNTAVAVSNGFFTTQIDFGAGAFAASPRWLQIGVRANGNPAAFAELTPLQPITATPFAVTAFNLAGPVLASNLAGTVSASNLPSALLFNGASNAILSGAFAGDGSRLTNISASNLSGSIGLGNLPPGLLSAVVTNNQSGVTLSGTFNGAHSGSFAGTLVGNGAGLTALNASALTSGTVGLAQLPVGGSNGLVVNGATFVNLNGAFSGFFSGNGSGLNSIDAGTLAGTITPNALSGTYPNALILTNPANILGGTIINAQSITANNQVGDLVVTNSALFTNAIVTITNNAGNGIVLGPGGETNSGSITFGGVIRGNGSGLTGLLSGSGLPVADTASLIASNTIQTATNGVLQAQITANAAAIAATANLVMAALQATNSILQGQINANAAAILTASNNVVTAYTSAGCYASFYSTATQTVPAGNQLTLVVEHTLVNKGWTVIGNTHFTPPVAGIYLVQYIGQVGAPNGFDGMGIYPILSTYPGPGGYLPFGQLTTCNQNQYVPVSGGFIIQMTTSSQLSFNYSNAYGNSEFDPVGGEPSFSFSVVRIGQ